jgi:hypothetical protein
MACLDVCLSDLKVRSKNIHLLKKIENVFKGLKNLKITKNNIFLLKTLFFKNIYKRALIKFFLYLVSKCIIIL